MASAIVSISFTPLRIAPFALCCSALVASQREVLNSHRCQLLREADFIFTVARCPCHHQYYELFFARLSAGDELVWSLYDAAVSCLPSRLACLDNASILLELLCVDLSWKLSQ